MDLEQQYHDQECRLVGGLGGAVSRPRVQACWWTWSSSITTKSAGLLVDLEEQYHDQECRLVGGLGGAVS